MKNFWIKTYGCQMNEYDTELIKSILTKNGYLEVDNEEKADVVLLNTCSVRENAHNKVYGRIQKLNKLRERKGNLIIGVLGCMAQNVRDDLLKKSVNVDIIAGPDSYRRLPNLFSEIILKKNKVFDTELSKVETYDDIYPTRAKGINAWIAIMRGCNNFCSFCVVPYTRGRERSRSVQSIVEETKRLVDDGYSQVTLLGQNVNSYEHNKQNFVDLIEAVAEVSGIKRIRFTSPHPKDFPDGLLDVINDYPQICKHIHLPLQAGSDRILKMMRRHYTSEEFLSLAKRIRDRVENIVLTTDIILGFPTETRQEFEQTVNVVKEVKFDSAFIFNYSERNGTEAARKWKDDVTADEKKYRITLLNETQKKISLINNQRHIDQNMEILIEGQSKKREHEWFGRTDGNKMVIFPHNGQNIGDYINVQIEQATSNTLKGNVI